MTTLTRTRRPLTILVTPLNWGLGHATRCIPIVRHLMEGGHRVILASDGQALRLLQDAFPTLPSHKLPAYNIRYPSGNMAWNLLWQFPKICWAIWREHRVVRKLVLQYAADGIISDNRFGCYRRGIPSAIICHQLRVGFGMAARLANAWISFRVKKFSALWVPDWAAAPGLAGALSHGLEIHPETAYIGVLSRMEGRVVSEDGLVLVVLSGPEPQRTRLEAIILEQLGALPYGFLLVRGLPEGSRNGVVEVGARGRMVDFLGGEELVEAVAGARVVVCRSGYTSLMDLAVMGKRVIFIPTPGQPEQEYLAEIWGRSGRVVVQNQGNLNLGEALLRVGSTSGLGLDGPVDLYRGSVDRWLEKVQG